MAKSIEGIKGTKLDSYTFEVELGKIREFAMAIGDENPAYMTGESVPPTYPTVIDFWGSNSSFGSSLGLNVAKVLHGGQEYEYLGKIRPGDEITVTGEVEDVYTKAAMNFFVVKKEYKNQHGETVLISRSTVIERH